MEKTPDPVLEKGNSLARPISPPASWLRCQSELALDDMLIGSSLLAMPSAEEIHFALILRDLSEGTRRLAIELPNTWLHCVYIDPVHCGTVHDFGKRLAATLAESGLTGPGLASWQIDAIRNLRGSYTFRARHDPRVSIFSSEALEGWTLICEEESLFALSCSPRQIYLKPIPDSWHPALLHVRSQLAEVALWPFDEQAVSQFRALVEPAQLRPLGVIA